MSTYKLKKVKKSSSNLDECTGMILNPETQIAVNEINIKYNAKIRAILFKMKTLQSNIIQLNQQRQLEIQKAIAKSNEKMKKDIKKNSVIPTTRDLLKR